MNIAHGGMFAWWSGRDQGKEPGLPMGGCSLAHMNDHMHVTYPGVYVDELPAGVKSIEGVQTSTAAFVGSADAGPVDQPVEVHSLADFERAFGPTAETDPMRLAIHLFFANGGTDGVIVRVGEGRTAPPAVAALPALDGVERFDLLCLPGLYADTASTAIPTIVAVLEAASRYCARRGAILLIDPLPDWQAAEDIVAGPSSIGAMTTTVQRENAVAFFPNLLVPTQSGPVTCAPAGAIAGVIARTDNTRGVWKAPAGEEAAIRGAIGLASAISATGASALRDVGVNTIRQLPGAGIISWGARLLSGATRGDPEWNYVNVRRLEIFLERSIDAGTAWAVFEPNDEPLWASVRQSVEAFLASLFRQGAFAGRTHHEAYFVKCGPDTMTQDEIDRGVVNIVVGFAPLRPAEFVIIRIQRRATDD
jgi:phage tail sheath protein FI